MKRIIYIALATLLISPIGFVYSAYLAEAIAADPAPSEVVVLEAPANFSDRAAAMGFSDVRKFVLEELDLTAYRVGVLNVDHEAAILRLEKAFPEAVIDSGAAAFN